MSFTNKCTVIYSVWTLDTPFAQVLADTGWGDADEWIVNDRRRAGSVSVRTDRQNKSGNWDISNKALTRSLTEGHYLDAWVTTKDIDIDGEDDGVLFVDDAESGMPTLQLEYERHHDIEQPSKGLFGEPTHEELGGEEMRETAETETTQENPTGLAGFFSQLSTAQTVGLVAVGVAVVGGLAYWLYQQSAAAQTAAGLPVVQTPTNNLNTLPVVQTPALPAAPVAQGEQLPVAGPSGTVPTGGEPGQWVQPPPNPAAYAPDWLNQEGASPGVDEPQTGYSYQGG